MPILSIEQSLYLFSETGYKPIVRVIKTGVGECSCRVHATAASLRTSERYPDRAVKQSKGGDFYMRTHQLVWEADDISPRELEIRIDDDAIAEQPEYFYLTISNEVAADVSLGRSHCFILNGDGHSFFGQYVTHPFSLMKADGSPLEHTALEVSHFGLCINDVNGMKYPDELLSQMMIDPNYFNHVLLWDKASAVRKNCCYYKDIGPATIFNGEFHVEAIKIPSHEAVRQYNIDNQTQYSEYSHVYVECPVTNNTPSAIPLTLSNSQFWMFRDMGTEEREERVNGSMTAMLLPNSNKIQFEFAKQTWKTALTGTWAEHKGETFLPSMHIFIGGTIPKV